MIYITTGYTKPLQAIETTLSDFDFITTAYQPRNHTAPEDADKTYFDKVLKPKADYMIAGEMVLTDGVYKRNDTTLLNQTLLVLDYDELNMTATELQEHIQQKIPFFSYFLYPTAKNTTSSPRYRLIVDVASKMTVGEYRATLSQLETHIGLPSDHSSFTWSQLQGLPLTINNSTYPQWVNRGGQFPVSQPLPELPTLNTTPVATRLHPISNIKSYSESKALEIMERYYLLNKEELDDYNFFVPALESLALAVQLGQIEEATALECVTLLAGDNAHWQQENISKLETEIINPNIQTEYDFSKRFVQFSYPKTHQQLESVLKWERARTREYLSDKRDKPVDTIHPLEVANILLKYLTFITFGDNDGERLAMYDIETGLYTQKLIHMYHLMSHIEPTLDERQSNTVLFHIRKQKQIRAKTNNRYLVPVNNGIFNLKSKELEPFHPKHVFIAKEATNYNPLATKSPVIEGWDFDTWLDNIACGDQEIVKLLWEVIADAINSNYNRKKSIWLVGDGNNGKGTFQQLLINLIGQHNVASLKMNQFSERFKMGSLVDKVVCIGDDVPAGVYIEDSGNFNSVATGDIIEVEEKHKSSYTTALNLSIIQSTNAMPRIKNQTTGTYRRLLIVPFNADFNGQKENRAIKERYLADPRVLEYVLNKAVKLDFNAFTIPAVVQQMLEAYKQDNDPIQEFKVEMEEYNLDRVPTQEVYKIYAAFCDENGYKAATARKFVQNFLRVLGHKWENKQIKINTSDSHNSIYVSTLANEPAVGSLKRCFAKR